MIKLQTGYTDYKLKYFELEQGALEIILKFTLISTHTDTRKHRWQTYDKHRWNNQNHIKLQIFTAQSWCSDLLFLSSVCPSHYADKRLWSEIAAAPVLTAGYPSERERNRHSLQWGGHWRCVEMTNENLNLTKVSSLIFLFNAGLSSFTAMLLYFSSI